MQELDEIHKSCQSSYKEELDKIERFKVCFTFLIVYLIIAHQRPFYIITLEYGIKL